MNGEDLNTVLRNKPWVGYLVSGLITIAIAGLGAYTIAQNEKGTYIERINTQQVELQKVKESAKSDHDAVTTMTVKVDLMQKDLTEVKGDVKKLLERKR